MAKANCAICLTGEKQMLWHQSKKHRASSRWSLNKLRASDAHDGRLLCIHNTVIYSYSYMCTVFTVMNPI